MRVGGVVFRAGEPLQRSQRIGRQWWALGHPPRRNRAKVDGWVSFSVSPVVSRAVNAKAMLIMKLPAPLPFRTQDIPRGERTKRAIGRMVVMPVAKVASYALVRAVDIVFVARLLFLTVIRPSPWRETRLDRTARCRWSSAWSSRPLACWPPAPPGTRRSISRRRQ
jgi:hypothetical protein